MSSFNRMRICSFISLSIHFAAATKVMFLRQLNDNPEHLGTVSVGTPAQAVYLAPDFTLDSTRLMHGDACQPFSQCFESASSSSFQRVSDSSVHVGMAMYGGDHFEATDRFSFGDVELNSSPFSHVTKAMIDDGLIRGVAGRLALSPNSPVAQQYVMELSGEDFYLTAEKVTPGFSAVFSRNVPAANDHVTEVSAPLYEDEGQGWRVPGQFIVCSDVINADNMAIQFDPTKEGVYFPESQWSHLKRTISYHTSIVPVEHEGVLYFPCDVTGAFTASFPTKVFAYGAGEIKINTLIKGPHGRFKDPKSGSMVCPSIFRTDYHSRVDHIVVGRVMFDTLASIVLDGPNKRIGFRTSFVQGPKRGVNGYILPPIPMHSVNYVFPQIIPGGVGIRFPSAKPADACKFFLTFQSARTYIDGQSLLYDFHIAAGGCNIPDTTKAIKGAFHLANNGKVIIDPQTNDLIIPLRIAESDTEPLYLVNVRTSSTFMHVLLEPFNYEKFMTQMLGMKL